MCNIHAVFFLFVVQECVDLVVGCDSLYVKTYNNSAYG